MSCMLKKCVSAAGNRGMAQRAAGAQQGHARAADGACLRPLWWQTRRDGPYHATSGGMQGEHIDRHEYVLREAAAIVVACSGTLPQRWRWLIYQVYCLQLYVSWLCRAKRVVEYPYCSYCCLFILRRYNTFPSLTAKRAGHPPTPSHRPAPGRRRARCRSHAIAYHVPTPISGSAFPPFPTTIM